MLAVFEHSAVLDHWILVKLKKTTIFQLSSYRIRSFFWSTLFLTPCLRARRTLFISSFILIRFGIFHIFSTECLLYGIYLAQSWMVVFQFCCKTLRLPPDQILIHKNYTRFSTKALSSFYGLRWIVQLTKYHAYR